MTERQAAERIAVAFEAGIAPWSRSSRLGLTCGLPVDASNGTPIRGVNTWLLELAAIERRFRNRFWATERQWEDLGGVVVRHEGTPILGATESNVVTLYNAEQVEVRPGAPVTAHDRFWIATQTEPDYDAAQKLVEVTGAVVKPSERCCCVITPDGTGDCIEMTPLDPLRDDPNLWWSVLFHELTHWVVLGRRRFGWRGDPRRGELAAELGAAILTTHCGISMDGDLPGDIDTVRAWVRGTRENLWYFELACDLAWVSAHYIVSLSRTAVPTCTTPENPFRRVVVGLRHLP